MEVLGHAVSGPTIALQDPGRANLLAIILNNLLSKLSRPLSGTYCLRSGTMSARILFGEPTRVESAAGPADCTMEGSLGTLIKLALGTERPVRAWLRGRVRFQGSLFKALAFLKAIRCRS